MRFDACPAHVWDSINTSVCVCVCVDRRGASTLAVPVFPSLSRARAMRSWWQQEKQETRLGGTGRPVVRHRKDKGGDSDGSGTREIVRLCVDLLLIIGPRTMKRPTRHFPSARSGVGQEVTKKPSYLYFFLVFSRSGKNIYCKGAQVFSVMHAMSMGMGMGW